MQAGLLLFGARMVLSLSGKCVGLQGVGLEQSISVWVHVAPPASMSRTRVPALAPDTGSESLRVGLNGVFKTSQRISAGGQLKASSSEALQGAFWE